jgi:hypothetical protein
MVDKLGSSTLPRTTNTTDQIPTSTGPAVRPQVTNPLEKNRIERAERDYALATLSPGEAAMGAAAKALGPHQSVEFSCKLGVDAGGVEAKGEGKIKIEKRDDGRYEVSVSGAVAAGAKHALAGVAAGTRFVVETPEAAADIAQAVATLGVATAAKASSPVFDLADRATGTSAHAFERLTHYGKNLTSVEVDARALVGAKLVSGTFGKAEVEGLAARGARINLETGEFVTTRRLEGTLEGSAFTQLGNTPAGKVLGQIGLNGSGELKASVTVEERRTVPPQVLEQFKRGEISALDVAKAVASAPGEYALVGKVEGEVVGGNLAAGAGKFEAKAELKIKDSELLGHLAKGDLSGLASRIANAPWEAEYESGKGSRVLVDTEVVSVKAGATVMTKHHLGSGKLGDLFGKAKGELEEGQRQTRFIDTQRALASLPR